MKTPPKSRVILQEASFKKEQKKTPPKGGFYQFAFLMPKSEACLW